MAELFIPTEELYELLKSADLPFTLNYANGQLLITGTVDTVIPLTYRAVMEFRKLSEDSVVLEITESSPSVGAIDHWLKSKIFQKLNQNDRLPARFNYPYISIDMTKLPQWESLAKWIRVTGVDFEAEGIRLTFMVTTDL